MTLCLVDVELIEGEDELYLQVFTSLIIMKELQLQGVPKHLILR